MDKDRSDKPNNRYLHIDLDDQGSVPKERVFTEPPIDYETALNKAFKERFINSPDHPVYRNAGSIVDTNFAKQVAKGVIKS